MAVSEFEIIERYFAHCGTVRQDVALGVGDDAALLELPPGRMLVAAVDALVEGVHFPVGTAPEDIGYRALAVNLSDLAAMGADPHWITLSLTLPAADESWLAGFAAGLCSAATAAGVALAGGDTTRGPLCIAVQALGSVPAGQALRRSGGRPGDGLFVTGTPGDAAAGLAELQASDPEQGRGAGLGERFLRPQPRISEGLSLRGLASAAIDVSDGLLADAARLATASGVGILIDLDALPLSRALLETCSSEQARQYALTGGDDYELLFTVPAADLARIAAVSRGWDCACTRIGTLRTGAGLAGRSGGEERVLQAEGYTHF